MSPAGTGTSSSVWLRRSLYSRTVGLQRRHPANAAARGLALTATVAGTVAIIVASLFARTNSSTYLVARLQPLRIFQLVYILMILALGAFLGQTLLQRKRSRWIVTFALLALIMLCAERYTFPNSAHFESPGREPRNDWERAFEWIRLSTPVDALFALDAHYVTQPGEDAQTFRAVAERSAIADYSKDGGEASITPALTSVVVHRPGSSNWAEHRDRRKENRHSQAAWCELGSTF